MRRLTFIFIAILALVAGLAQSGLAISILDLNTSDANSIIPNPTNGTSNTLTVTENYGETYLIPYPSHDGQAIVNSPILFPSNRYFDKVVTPDSAGAVQITFAVTNTGLYTWSDYHFLIYDTGFSTPLAILNSASVNFPFLQNINYLSNPPPPYTGVEFYEPSPVPPGQTVTFVLNLTSDGTAFGVRQIATVPLPGAVWLLGGGLAGLLGFRGFRRRS
jgi:hypothetical protein